MVSPAWSGVSTSATSPFDAYSSLVTLLVLLVLRRHGPPPLCLRVSTNMAQRLLPQSVRQQLGDPVRNLGILHEISNEWLDVQ